MLLISIPLAITGLRVFPYVIPYWSFLFFPCDILVHSLCLFLINWQFTENQSSIPCVCCKPFFPLFHFQFYLWYLCLQKIYISTPDFHPNFNPISFLFKKKSDLMYLLVLEYLIFDWIQTKDRSSWRGQPLSLGYVAGIFLWSPILLAQSLA